MNVCNFPLSFTDKMVGIADSVRDLIIPPELLRYGFCHKDQMCHKDQVL